MAHTSIINHAQIEGARRLDAEYYHPQNQTLMACLRQNCDLWSISRSAVLLTDMGAFSLYRKEFFVEDGIPFLRVENIKENFLDLSDTISISTEYHTQLSKSQVHSRDVLLTTKAIIGMACVVPDNIGECNMSQNLVRIRFKDFLNPYFVSTFLSCKYGVFQSNRLATGNVQLYLNFQNIGEILIPKFTDKFQNEIEVTVKSAEKNFQTSIDTSNQAEHVLYSELSLLNWHPARALTYVRSYNQASQSRRIDAEHFHPKYRELREHIRNYPNGYLRITDIAVNSTETIEPHDHAEDDYLYIELADINQVVGTIESANEIKGKDAPSRARMLLHAGDVIASTVEGSLDKIALVSEKYQGAIGSTGFFVLRPRTVQSGYLLALVKSMIVREQMRCESSGTILAAVPAKSLRNIIVPNIPHEKRSKIAQLIEESHVARQEAKNLLEKAKRAIEIAIEENEEQALEFIR